MWGGLIGLPGTVSADSLSWFTVTFEKEAAEQPVE
jgi:hypothetical protein